MIGNIFKFSESSIIRGIIQLIIFIVAIIIGCVCC